MEETGLDRYQIIIGLFVIVAFGSLLFWFSIFKSAGDEANTVQGWLTTRSGGITFQYPERLTTRYVTPVDWPPQVTLEPTPLNCDNADPLNSETSNTISRVISERNFCITEVSQGTGHNILSHYTYAFEKDKKVVVFKFSLSYLECESLVPGAMQDCQTERNVFDLDGLVSQISGTIKFP